MLKILYGLTTAEANVAVHLASGETVSDAAESLGVSRTTLRNELVAAMAKLGVHRQAEMVALVAGLTPRVDLGS
jgi:DNA-binding NarL/FixJ family response regulator